MSKGWIIIAFFSLAFMSRGVFAEDRLSVADAQKLVDDAEAKLTAAQQAAADRAESTDAYKKLAAEVATKKQALDTARQLGSIQEKLDAGSEYNVARAKLAALRKKSIDADAGIPKAQAAIDAANLILGKAQNDQVAADAADKEAAAQRAAEEEKKDFDATKAREQLTAWREIRDTNQKTKIIRIYGGNTDTSQIDADIADNEAKIRDLSKKLLAWNDQLPDKTDIPVKLKGKTLEEAESLLGTKLAISSSTDSFTNYHVQAEEFTIYVTVDRKTGKVSFSDVIMNR